jgi:DNA polymerase (family 10)
VRDCAILSDADLGPLLDAPPPGVSADVLKQLRDMFEAGAWVFVESAVADLPADLRWLFESGAVTLEQLAMLHRALGATSATDLHAAVRRGAIRGVPGLGPGVEAAVADALQRLRAPMARLPLGQAMAIAESFMERLRGVLGVTRVDVLGSLRRGEDTVGDIEILAPFDNPTRAFNALLELPDMTRCLHRSPRRLYLLTDRVQVGIRSPKPKDAGAALLHLTGSVPHLNRLRDLAGTKGWSLEPEGLDRGEGRPLLSESEEQIYAALDLPWIPPEIRGGEDEIDAALAGTLPSLVSRETIRGDLHMHTDFSDGRDSVGAMVKACVALGYDYLAITDHSPHSSASRNLSTDSVKRQAEEIARLRERHPQVTILHGCEVDILLDGRLDFTDRVLEGFDIVLASLHERGGHGPEQLMRRYDSAMRHPLVTMITHPTNRQLPHRPGYDLDYDRLFALAAETGTVVEIDGAPAHLDLDGRLARRAIAAGATVAVDSDCHRAEMLERQMRLGILTARRGWVEPRHVLNARRIEDVRAFIAAKRGGP